jgi:hypothetical protein
MSKVVVWGSKASSPVEVKPSVYKLKATEINIDIVASKASNTIWWENNRLVINTDISSIDIIEIHSMIREKTKAISKMTIKANKLKESAEKTRFMIEKNNFNHQYREITAQIKELEALKSKYDDYCGPAKPIILNFRNLSPDKTVIFGKTDVRYNDDKIDAIKDYLVLLKKVIDFDIILQPKPDNVCLECSSVICPFPITPGIITCQACGIDKIVYASNEVYKSRGTDNSYEDISNFSKTLLRFQGKQKIKFGQELYGKLDDYFKRIEKLTSDVIRDLPVLSNGKKQGTSYNLLYTALFETCNSGHYEDANLIAHYYWGWKLPEISSGMEKKILDQYALTQKVFRNMPIDLRGRKSSLNTQYRLFKHLQLAGYPCSITDFKIPDTNDVVEKYDETWLKMCEECDLPFIPTK